MTSSKTEWIIFWFSAQSSIRVRVVCSLVLQFQKDAKEYRDASEDAG